MGVLLSGATAIEALGGPAPPGSIYDQEPWTPLMNCLKEVAMCRRRHASFHVVATHHGRYHLPATGFISGHADLPA